MGLVWWKPTGITTYAIKDIKCKGRDLYVSFPFQEMQGGFAFVTLNIAVENIRRPVLISEQEETKNDQALQKQHLRGFVGVSGEAIA